MKITEILRINSKKLKKKFGKSLFLIIPVTILMALSVVIGSQVENIKGAIEGTVFDTISNQYRLIQIAIQEKEFDPRSFLQGSTDDSSTQTKYSESDVETISAIDGVQSASLLSSIPIRNIKTTDLVKEKAISFSQLYALDSSTASLYTDSDFTYEEGKEIPIILNTSSLIHRYEDWNGKDKVSFDMSKAFSEPNSEGPARLSINKEEAIALTKEDLIGKTFTLSFGGLDDIQDYTVTRDGTSITFNKLTTDEYNKKVEDRKASIAKYWDYSKISKPATYTFKVVGVIEDSTNQINYVPDEFANAVIKDYVSNEINARVKSIDNDLLNSDYLGFTYNGDEFSNGGGSIIGQIGKRFEGAVHIAGEERPRVGGGFVGSIDFKAEDVNFSAITIPGLVILVDSSNKVTGVNTDPDIYTKANKYGDKMNIVLVDSTKRESVIAKLNKAGFSYQDNNQVEVLSKLQSSLGSLAQWFMIAFVVLLASVIVLTMSKFISEAIKEIGIFRALGMTEINILVMFITQTIMYVLTGYIFGVALGYVLNQVTGVFVNTWFIQFIKDTVSQSYSVVSTVDSTLFMNTNWGNILIYTAVLFAISLIISIIPSMSAAKVSPVEAIKSE
ncbi:FtsX-like permease family protein [Candidatus Dojkabacteria bacterium]|nr:FtsX-like permease family protein [Candidatus Dojkabacteria bacterium]